MLLEALAGRALPPVLRQEVRKVSSRDKDLLANLRAFAAVRQRGDAEARRVWRLIYHLENLSGMARSHHSLPSLVDELLARPIGAGRNPLEEHHDDLSEPSLYPGAAALARRLTQAVTSGARVWIEPRAGAEIPLAAMLRGGGVSNTQRLDATDQPAADDIVLRAGDGPDGGRPIRVFKALQLMQTGHLKNDFDDFVAFDLETSDFDSTTCEIVEIAAVRVRGKVVVAGFQSLVACTRPISAAATAVHGYTDHDVATAPPMSEVWPLPRVCRHRHPGGPQRAGVRCAGPPAGVRRLRRTGRPGLLRHPAAGAFTGRRKREARDPGPEVQCGGRQGPSCL